jgi:hypothetical protein
MVEYAGADDVIEAPLQLVYPIDGEVMDIESAQLVLLLEFLGTAHARRAEIDAGDPGPRPPQGIPGRLRCAASRNEDGVILPIGKSGPEKMMIRAAFLWVLPEPSIVLEAVDRRGIRVSFVEVLDSRRHSTGRMLLFIVGDGYFPFVAGAPHSIHRVVSEPWAFPAPAG